MPKYHVNPNTGDPGVCRATKNCPYGDLEKDHYATKEEAAANFELKMETTVIVNNENFSGQQKAYENASVSFVETLTEEEKTAVEAYVNQEYSSINEKLWAGKSHPLVSYLDSALEKAPKTNKTIYRKVFLGHDEEDIKQAIAKVKAGNTIQSLGYSSFSENINSIFPIAHPTPRPSPWGEAEDRTSENVVFEVTSALGAPVSSLSHMPQEHEWLLPRNMTLEIKNVQTKDFESNISILGDFVDEPIKRRLTLVQCEIVEGEE